MSERLPSADEVTTYIRQGFCDWVVDMPAGTRTQPEELWVPALACWVKADGSSICGDRGRGYAYPGLIGRARIKNAVKWFRTTADRETVPARKGE